MICTGYLPCRTHSTWPAQLTNNRHFSDRFVSIDRTDNRQQQLNRIQPGNSRFSMCWECCCSSEGRLRLSVTGSGITTANGEAEPLLGISSSGWINRSLLLNPRLPSATADTRETVQPGTARLNAGSPFLLQGWCALCVSSERGSELRKTVGIFGFLERI